MNNFESSSCQLTFYLPTPLHLLPITQIQIHKYRETKTGEENSSAVDWPSLFSSAAAAKAGDRGQSGLLERCDASKQDKQGEGREKKCLLSLIPLVRSPGPLVLGFTGAIWLFAFVMWTKMANGEHIPKCENITVESVNKCISTAKRGAQHRPTEVNIFTTFAKI